MDTLGICIVGTGRAGSVHANNIARRIPETSLIALCDTDAKALERTGAEFDVPRLYSDYTEAVADSAVDAVVVVAPTFVHRDIACAAAAQKKHVFLEKPMAITVEECAAINAAVSAAGVKLQLGFMRRFDEGFLKAKAILDSKELGRTMVVKSTGRGPGLPPPWIFDIAKSNGVLAEVNSHDVDSLRWLVGNEIVRVFGEADNFKCLHAREEYPDFYDNAVVTLRFADGTIGVIDGTCPCHYGYDARVEVLCEKGVLFIGSLVQQGVTKVTVEGHVTGEAVRSWRTLFETAYLKEMEHFVECILEDTAPRVTGEDGMKAVEVVVAANHSIKTGLPVALSGEEAR